MIKASIVLPTFNQCHFLSQAIESILNQTYKDFELIIVNDGSTDETATLLSALNHPQIKIITQENKGLPAALNAGFANACGDYFTWTSTDNHVSPNWLSELVTALDNSPEEIAYAFSYYAVIDESGKILFVNKDQRFDIPSLLMRHAGNASFLYRASLAKKVGLYDTELSYAEDLDMWIRMAELTRAVHVQFVLYYYRVHQDSMTSQQDKVRLATMKTVNKYLDQYDGKFNIDKLFPNIANSPDVILERWKSRIWLATLGMNAHFYCPVEALVDQLQMALKENYDNGLIGNIVHLYSKISRWDLATEVVSHYRELDKSQFLANLAMIISKKSDEDLKNIPFLTIQESLLQETPTITNKNQSVSFDKLVVDLMNQLEDFKNHTNVWNNIAALKTPEEKEFLHHLRLYLTDLIKIPQDPKAILYIATLEAICFAHTVDYEIAKERLEIMNHQLPNAEIIKSALLHLKDASLC